MAYIEPEEIHYNNSVINALVKHGMRFSGIQKKHSKETVQDNLFFDILIKGTRKEKLSRIISLTKICIHTALDPLKNKNATLKKQIFSFFLCLKQIRKKLSFPIIPKPLIRDISNTAYKEHPDLKDISDALKQRSRYKEFNFNTPLEFIVNTYALTEKKYQDYNLKLFDPSFWENNCIEALSTRQ